MVMAYLPIKTYPIAGYPFIGRYFCKKSVQVTGHYSAHIGIAPSIHFDRISPEVSLSKICIFAPCNCYTFCQTILAPYLNFNTGFWYFLV
jgi:hypothetical protein